MILEAVWYKEGKEIRKVSPVFDIKCKYGIENISEIEIYNGCDWYSSFDYDDVDDFVIRIKKVNV